MNKILYIILISFIVSNCSFKPVVKHHGVPFLEKKQASLKINESNKNDIINILGAPSTKSLINKNLWIYIENRQTTASFLKLGKTEVKENNVLVVEINEYGILKDKKFYNNDDQNKIIFSEKETQMSEKDSFVYSVVSSIRQKIDSPKRQRNNIYCIIRK